MTNRTIPQCRDLLAEIAAGIRSFLPATAEQIDGVIEDMKRRPAVRRAPAASIKMTPELRQRIAEYAREHENLTYHAIGTVFGVNGARVSEAVAGFRQ